MRRWNILLVTAIVVIIVDQVSKQMVIRSLPLGASVNLIPALSPLFQITYSENTGAAFGLLPQAGPLFLLIAVVVVAAMFIFYRRVPEKALLTRIAIGLISGGALGNVINRLQYGAVIDFIHYQIPGIISNVSNLADHAIVFGVILIFLSSWRSERVQPAHQEE
jgi:signal peptidase II